MKNIILITAILFSIACKAQEPFAKLTSRQVKASGITFSVRKITTELGRELIGIANAENRLADVKQVWPKMLPGIQIAYYMSYDNDILVKICADAISPRILNKLPVDSKTVLSIGIKFDPSGRLLELEYLIPKTFMITPAELAKIEVGIKNSKFRITFKKELQPFVVGANFFNMDSSISYTDLLKARTGIAGPQ